jgi:urea transport system substrate-binding protein
MSHRRRSLPALVLTSALAASLALAGCSGGTTGGSGSGGGTIKLGMLFSLTGGLALGEVPMYNAAKLAVDEINAKGGIEGKKIVPVVEDYNSDIQTAVEKADQLVNSDHTIATVGTYTSASRQAVLPTYQKAGNLLLYPTINEGLECSPNAIYTGVAPNQSVTLGVPWMLQNLGKKVYLLGSDYVFPHTMNAMVKELVKKGGGQVVGEDYFPLGDTDFGTVAAKIKASGADVVFNAVVADSVPPLYQAFADAGITQAQVPIVSVATTESELQAMDPKVAAGSYSLSPYFQTLDNAANQKFVKAATAVKGQTFTSREMAAAYSAVYLFKAAYEKAGKNPTTQQIIDAFPGASFDGPEGTITVAANHYSTVDSRIGKIDDSGKIVTEKDFGPVKPDPFPKEVVAAANIPTCPTPYQG